GNQTAWPKGITQQHLAVEFTEWMRERWNHPCVVIWDAQNETTDDRVVAATLMAVRGLDLSNRPWDNGWGTPQKPGDISEAHPYRAGRKGFFANFANETGIPDNGPKKKDAARPPYLINEYGWLWINRDGTLPTLTVDVYKRLLGEKATVAERFRYYART
ncbi:MAG: glycoside hydrolase family 2 TIM barrel-domain containing protein, partial [Verrucomicrobiia bacterium]